MSFWKTAADEWIHKQEPPEKKGFFICEESISVAQFLYRRSSFTVTTSSKILFKSSCWKKNLPTAKETTSINKYLLLSTFILWIKTTLLSRSSPLGGALYSLCASTRTSQGTAGNPGLLPHQARQPELSLEAAFNVACSQNPQTF